MTTLAAARRKLAPDLALVCDRTDTVLASHGQAQRHVDAATGGPRGAVLAIDGVVEWVDGLAAALTLATGMRLEGWRVVDGRTVIVLS